MKGHPKTKRGAHKRLDLSGKRFGRLVAFRISHRSDYNHIFWLCSCDCGKEKSVDVIHLRSGHTKSCGCLVADTLKGNTHKPRFLGQNAGPNAVFSKYRHGAVSRGLPFDLSVINVRALISSNCAYCGSPPSNTMTFKKRHQFKYNGIDRLNNLSGYTVENCVPCCNACNHAKKTMSLSEFREFIERISSHLPHWPDGL